MIRQLWHVLFGHLWELDEDLPVIYTGPYFDIVMNVDVVVENHYSRCHCGLMKFGWSAYTPRVEIFDDGCVDSHEAGTCPEWSS